MPDDRRFFLNASDVAKLRQLFAWAQGNGWGRVAADRVRPPILMLARATADIEKGEWGKAKLLRHAKEIGEDGKPTKGDEEEGDEIDVYARLGDVTADAQLYVLPVGLGYEVIVAECEVE